MGKNLINMCMQMCEHENNKKNKQTHTQKQSLYEIKKKKKKNMLMKIKRRIGGFFIGKGEGLKGSFLLEGKLFNSLGSKEVI